MTSRPHRRPSLVWGLTALAVLAGVAVGWQLAASSATDRPDRATTARAAATGPAVETTAGDGRAAARPVADGVADSVAGSAIETATGWLRQDRVGAAPPPGAAWPIVLHRAGDGQFYADLSLDGHIVNGRIDPTEPHTTLRATDLPLEAGHGAAGWQVDEVFLEHRRLPAARLLVQDDPDAETVIGDDLLGRFFAIEERFDRLRLVPHDG